MSEVKQRKRAPPPLDRTRSFVVPRSRRLELRESHSVRERLEQSIGKKSAEVFACLFGHLCCEWRLGAEFGCGRLGVFEDAASQGGQALEQLRECRGARCTRGRVADRSDLQQLNIRSRGL